VRCRETPPKMANRSLTHTVRHVATTYPSLSLIAEPSVAPSVEGLLPGDIYTTTSGASETRSTAIQEKTDIVATFGGDGTILHASSLFSTSPYVPPILSFSMGTLGFLGEWRFEDYKRAFRETYMSGAPSLDPSTPALDEPLSPGRAIRADGEKSRWVEDGWSTQRGKRMGSGRGARVLLRRRLKVAISNASGEGPMASDGSSAMYAMNEVLLHRGSDPHLTHISVTVNGRFLTEAVADGMLVSTPTGSTAYSLSAGGSIVHPLVESLLLTSVCPRSLSFRPVVLPANMEVVLRLSEHNRGRQVELGVDGERQGGVIGVGTEIRVTGEELVRGEEGWSGGVPCLTRGGEKGGDDGWVGGLNSLLKFNYPFGEG
jgi:NADH kinase